MVGQGVGGHRQDRRARRSTAARRGCGGWPRAVHLRHLDIHQDQVVGLAPQASSASRPLPAMSAESPAAPGAGRRHALVDRVVLGHAGCAGRRWPAAASGSARAAAAGSTRRRRRGGAAAQRRVKRKVSPARARSRRRLRRPSARPAAADGQAQAGAAVAARGRAVGLGEGLEQAVACCSAGMPMPVSAHREAQLDGAVRRSAPAARAQPHVALRR